MHYCRSRSRLKLAATVRRCGSWRGKPAKKTKENLGEGGGDAQPNPKLSHNLDLRSLRPLPKEWEVGGGVKKPETQGLPGANLPSEQLWRPVLPKDQEKIEAFVNDLAQNKEEVLGQLESFLSKPNKTRDDEALAIYLDAVVKRDVLGIDPFASKQFGDEAHQETRENIALLATEHVGQRWLDEHPDSQLAVLVADLSIYAPDFMHRAFLYEIWPSVRSKIATED